MHKDLREYVIKLLEKGYRLDGRAPLDYRKPIELKVGMIPTAEGSAQVKVGDTEVIIGVKMEVGTPYPDTPNEGGIIIGAELLPLSNPDFEAGPPGIQSIELARLVDRGIRESKSINTKELCIEPGKKVWNIIVDICTINDAGNLLDASALATVAAIIETKFPKYENDVVDYKTKTDVKLNFTDLPVTITVFKVGDFFFVDPDIEEEKVYDARLTVTTMQDDSLCSLQKGGNYPITVEDIDKMVSIAIEKARELRAYLKN